MIIIFELKKYQHSAISSELYEYVISEMKREKSPTLILPSREEILPLTGRYKGMTNEI